MIDPMWDWLLQFVTPLERAGVPYAIVGSVASSVYGDPRATNEAAGRGQSAGC